MAASNYYAGYTSGAQHSQGFTQVQNPPIQTSYTAPQASTGYAVQGTAPTAAHYGPPQTQTPRQVVQPAAYSAASSAYAQTAPTQGSAYGYTARQQDAPPPPPPTNTAYQAASHAGYQAHPASQSYYERDAYDNKATYYSQQPASSVQVSQGGYYAQGATATAKGAYQASVASAYPTPVSATRVAAKSHPVQAYTSSSTVAYPYSTGRSHSNYNNQGSYSTSNYGSSNTAGGESYHPQAYEAAVYNAAAAYVQQQQQHQTPRSNWKNKGGGMGGMGSNKQQKPKAPPKQPQIHYCDICKISCAGPQTYKEHLEGQKHKKKEAASKAKPDVSSNNSNCYQCELCNITCTGADAYAAHLKGAKHQKVVNLHVKMGRPIPEIQPIKVPESKEGEDKTKTTGGNRNHNRKPGAKRGAAPKITFVGGTKLTTTGIVKSDSTGEGTAATQVTQQQGQVAKEDESMETGGEAEEKFDLATFTGVDKSKIVGADYLEEIKSDEGKVVSFHCKLCECKFNDPNAKEAHLAGRRHRLQFKKKVQPDLVVETKPSNRRLSKSQEEKLRHRWEQEQMWRWREDARWHEEEAARRWEEEEYVRRMEEERFWEEEHRRRYEAEFHDWNDRSASGAVPPRLMDAPPGMPHMRPRYTTADDHMVMAKHSAIYPTEAELQAVQNIVSSSEKALKLVSDVISEQDSPQMEVEGAAEGEKDEAAVKKEPEPEVNTEATEAAAAEKTEGEGESENKEASKSQTPRALKGVMRVGVLAKGLLLRGRLDVDLVVLCHNGNHNDKPTSTLLKRVSDLLPVQLAKVTEEKYDIKTVPEESSLKISTLTEPTVVVTVTLTSPIMRDSVEPTPAEDEADVLDRPKCLDALAALRHAKWFQAKANSLQSCVVIIRVMREMCQRVPVFSPISEWALELLVEKSLSSSEQPLGPGEAFRRVLECISTGLFLEGGSGLCDPCEKDAVNACSEITAQEAEDLTAAAQHALRLQAFRQLHKVLGIDPPPPTPRYRGRYPRGGRFKRRREDSGQGDEGAKKEKKEGEGEVTGEVMETSTDNKDAANKTPAKAEA